MPTLDGGEIALLITAIPMFITFYVAPARRPAKIIAYIGSACGIIGVLAGYALIGFVVLLAAFAASAVIQIVTGIARS